MKNRLDNFTIVDNNIINNKNLSLSAKGLYSFLCSKPSYWEFSINGVASQLKEGDKAIKTAIRQLEEHKALARVRAKTKRGHWGFDWILNPTEEDIEQSQKDIIECGGLPPKGVDHKGVDHKGVDHKGGDIDNTIPSNTKGSNTKGSKKNTKKEKSNFQIFIDEVKKSFSQHKIATFGGKISRTKDCQNAFDSLHDEVPSNLAYDYTQYVKRNRNLSVRLDKYIVAYLEGNLKDIEYAEKQTNKQEAQEGSAVWMQEQVEKQAQVELDGVFDVEEIRY